jgi:putative ABC transport system permease protein
MAGFTLPFRLARRELRGGLKGFRIFLACLTLGVAAIAGVGSLSQGLTAGLREDARSLLGGDVSLRLSHRAATPEQRAWLEAGAGLSEVVEMRAMARVPEAPGRTLVELKAVDGRYPLYGAVELEPAMALEAALEARDGAFGAAVDEGLLARLGLALGDELRIGEARYAVRATIQAEPDRGSSVFTLGPRVLVAAASLAATGLVREGSLIRYHYRLRLAEGSDHRTWIATLKERFPDAGWRIRDFTNAAPEVQRFIDRVTLFLTLVGLTALLVGGVGVGNAVNSYLEGKTATIATLKCLGASGGLIFRVYLVQTMIMALAGIALGLGLGVLVPALAGKALAGAFPFAARLGLYPGPLALAAVFGVLTSLTFAQWPLARAREVSAAGLFRHIVAPARRLPRPTYLAATALAGLGLAGLAVASAADRPIALWFVASAALAFVVFALSGRLLKRLAAGAPNPRRPGLRLALANIHRPGAPTSSVVLSLGFGLTVLVAVAAIERNLTRQLEERLPEAAPSFFFIDIQPDQAAAFDNLVAAVPGASGLRRVPSLRGRVVALDGVPAEQISAKPDHQWVLRSDRGITYASEMPPGTRLVAGEWWPPDYRGPPLLSMDAHIAEGFGLGIGDTVTLNILGREITATIANLRQIDWTTLGINYVLVLAPGTLEAAPHTHIATVRASVEAEDELEAAVTDRFANVSAIRVRAALESVNAILLKIGVAIRLTASVTILAGALVLAGAIAASHHRRVYDSVVLKVLGATRGDIARAYLAEYAILGVATAAIAAALGSVASWAVLTQVMNADWQATPGAALLISLGGVAVTVALGFVGTWRALGAKAAPVLRTE